jgi:hypothetical protein
MRQLLGDRTLDDRIFSQLCTKQLPSRVREIIAIISTTAPLEELAAIADKVLEGNPPAA